MPNSHSVNCEVGRVFSQIPVDTVFVTIIWGLKNSEPWSDLPIAAWFKFE
jgi:hypothetical protein